jgi:integrase
VTICKELVTFKACWNWARSAGLVKAAFPDRDLMLPKLKEAEPFLTWKEVVTQISLGCIGEGEARDLWDRLFLSRAEIDELLAYVEGHAEQEFLAPLFAFAAFTGARRSEMMRAQRADVDLDAGAVVLREKKRVKGVLTSRRVKRASGVSP